MTGQQTLNISNTDRFPVYSRTLVNGSGRCYILIPHSFLSLSRFWQRAPRFTCHVLAFSDTHRNSWRKRICMTTSSQLAAQRFCTRVTARCALTVHNALLVRIHRHITRVLLSHLVVSVHLDVLSLRLLREAHKNNSFVSHSVSRTPFRPILAIILEHVLVYAQFNCMRRLSSSQ